MNSRTNDSNIDTNEAQVHSENKQINMARAVSRAVEIDRSKMFEKQHFHKLSPEKLV